MPCCQKHCTQPDAKCQSSNYYYYYYAHADGTGVTVGINIEFFVCSDQIAMYLTCGQFSIVRGASWSLMTTSAVHLEELSCNRWQKRSNRQDLIPSFPTGFSGLKAGHMSREWCICILKDLIWNMCSGLLPILTTLGTYKKIYWCEQGGPSRSFSPRKKLEVIGIGGSQLRSMHQVLFKGV